MDSSPVICIPLPGGPAEPGRMACYALRELVDGGENSLLLERLDDESFAPLTMASRTMASCPIAETMMIFAVGLMRRISLRRITHPFPAW